MRMFVYHLLIRNCDGYQVYVSNQIAVWSSHATPIRAIRPIRYLSSRKLPSSVFEGYGRIVCQGIEKGICDDTQQSHLRLKRSAGSTPRPFDKKFNWISIQ